LRGRRRSALKDDRGEAGMMGSVWGDVEMSTILLLAAFGIVIWGKRERVMRGAG
jgi:hypothetical protein